jgi:hypothetical protein
MTRICACFVAVVLVASPLHHAMAQSATAADGAKPSRVKLSMEKLRAMKAKWNANRPKMKVCRQEVKAKGLAGDDRWFYMQDCMTKG